MSVSGFGSASRPLRRGSRSVASSPGCRAIRAKRPTVQLLRLAAREPALPADACFARKDQTGMAVRDRDQARRTALEPQATPSRWRVVDRARAVSRGDQPPQRCDLSRGRSPQDGRLASLPGRRPSWLPGRQRPHLADWNPRPPQRIVGAAAEALRVAASQIPGVRRSNAAGCLAREIEGLDPEPLTSSSSSSGIADWSTPGSSTTFTRRLNSSLISLKDRLDRCCLASSAGTSVALVRPLPPLFV